ncbi:MAG: hypothetical protein P1S46_07980 [bacterium]|nr:hypothetical protein [bacterium]MDT8396696.1 hypothetical protein [bacterium]
MIKVFVFIFPLKTGVLMETDKGAALEPPPGSSIIIVDGFVKNHQRALREAPKSMTSENCRAWERRPDR